MKNSSILGVTALILSLASFAGNVNAHEGTTFTASSSARGTTTTIPESTIQTLCGDGNGCSLRLAMFNWDGTRRTASRESLFFYDNGSRTWRASRDDKSGENDDNRTDHVMNAWSCYFTDGNYRGFTNLGDPDVNFGVLSWNQYDATCKVTIID